MMRQKESDSVEQHRINRINMLLDRLDRIPGELDRIHEKLLNPAGFTRDEYIALVNRRDNLYVEYDRVENELKKAYRMKF